MEDENPTELKLTRFGFLEIKVRVSFLPFLPVVKYRNAPCDARGLNSYDTLGEG